jgi:hypothetical protein
MISKLTAGQEAMLPVIRDEWLAHGLSTQPADRPAAEQGIRAAYQAAGLDPPRFIIWLGSPWAGVLGQSVAPGIVAEMVGGQVRGQGGGHVAAQVRGHVRGQVHDQVQSHVDDQVHDQVRDYVRGQVHSHVRGQVGNHVDGPVASQVWGQVGNQVWGHVRDHVRDIQVGVQVRDHVYRQVRDHVDGHVGSHVDSHVRDQVGDHVRDHVYIQVGNQVWGQVCDHVRDHVRDWYKALLYGQHNAGYYSYYDAMERIGVTGLDLIHGQQQVARSAGWWWAYQDFAVITERPAALHRDANGDLHSADSMAISYPDGWGFWCWHGRRVPQWVVERPGVERIAVESNVEIRRCAIESLGWDRFTREAGLHLVADEADPGNPGQNLVLYDVPERLWGSRIQLVLCTNGSSERDGTRRRYGMTVPADFTDPVSAIAWTGRMTRDQYVTMQRRT